MAGKKVVLVFGATGAQGGAVADALLEDGTFAVRAVTRDTSKPVAVKLSKAGAEVVSADLDNEKSLEAALSGAYGAFVVTNAFEGSKKDKEVIQGKLVADLCKRLNLELVVYSGLENVKKITCGKLEVPHFDSKGEVEEYFRHIDCPMTSVRVAFYYENLQTAFKPQRSKDGKMLLLGAQGGSVVSALLKDRSFSVRAVTRDTSKPAAVKLKAAGAEVVSADLDNEKSLEAALSGAYGAFLVTNFWDHFSKEKEVQQGKCLVDLCKRLGLQHVVYSGLENVKKISGGKLDVRHFDSKGEVEEYFREKSCPMTSVRLAFYFENFLTNCKPQKSKDCDSYDLVIPMCDVPMDGISVSDLGSAVVTILKSPKEYIGKNIGLSAEKLTVAQYAAIMSKVSGKVIKDAKMSPEVYEKLPFQGAEEMANMFKFYLMIPDRDVALTHKLNPNTKSFQQWLEENKETFIKAL